MLWVKKGTHVIDHPRFLDAGAIARDLYDWGMLYSGKFELDGEIPMVAVIESSWGAKGKANVKVASKLVEVGLWDRTDTGFRIRKWAEQGNQTKAQIDADRAAARERISKKRSESVRANYGRTSVDVPTSTSTSTSDLALGSEIAPEPETGVRLAGGPPSWFPAALDVIEMNAGVRLQAGEAWLRYSGHRADKGKAMTQPDAQYWLTTVMVPEHHEQARKVSREAARDETFRLERQAKQGPEVKPLPKFTKAREEEWERTAASQADQVASAAELQKLLGGIGGGR